MLWFRSEFRKVYVPPHRLTPLKENWLKIVQPIVEHMKLQIRMNLHTKNVELKVLEMWLCFGDLRTEGKCFRPPNLHKILALFKKQQILFKHLFWVLTSKYFEWFHFKFKAIIFDSCLIGRMRLRCWEWMICILKRLQLKMVKKNRFSNLLFSLFWLFINTFLFFQ